MKNRVWKTGWILAALFVSGFFLSPAYAKVVEYHLTIAQKKIAEGEKGAMGMTINGGIPGPVLHFTEGDTARIFVHNEMNVSTSIHWHGMLVPNAMDGVPYVTYPPIGPGATFAYEFPIRQSGTYWYHSHSGLQEQSGVYGALVIAPPQGSAVHADHDEAIVLSDWTTENPRSVMRTLKRGSEWYSIQRGSAQSLFGAVKAGRLGDYMKRELLRMPPMDLSDVAYDYFLANGKPEISIPAEPGETLRLRFVDGSSMTYFYLEYAGGPMRIIAADGQNVEPLEERRFLIAVAETYDVLVKVPAAGAYELRATAHDGSGYASIWIGRGKRHPTAAVPQPDLYASMMKPTLRTLFALTPAGTMGMGDALVKAGKFDRPGMAMTAGMDMSSMASMSGMKKTEEGSVSQKDLGGKKFTWNFFPLAADVSHSHNLAVDGMSPERPRSPYAQLRSVKPTTLGKDKPDRIVRLTLDGDMGRYVWSMNNKRLLPSDTIRIRKGEVVRFIMINRTMMHHPMHLHGHSFRVINGQGDYAPLKHTVDVAPMSTTAIEFLADETGDWFFHCHFLYHMMSGMARVVHYESFTLNPQLAAVRPKLYKDAWYAWAQADGLSNMTRGFLTTSDTRNILTAEWEIGWPHKKPDDDWETVLTYDRYINRFFSVFAGGDLFGRSNPLGRGRGVFGMRYLLPLNAESRFWADTSGGARIHLGKTIELTPRLSLFGEAEYDTHKLWKGSSGLAYLLSQSFSFIAQWHSEFGWGGGLRWRF